MSDPTKGAATEDDLDLDGLLETPGEDEDVPDFQDLFDEGPAGDLEDVDDSRDSFRRPERIEGPPQPYFADKDFYKKVLGGEGEVAKRVHKLLADFLSAKDPKDRSLHRSRLIPAYWELANSIAAKIHSKLPVPKVLMLRFGLLLPTTISAEQRKMISRIIYENTTDEPIFYVDDWLREVGRGNINSSATDETKNASKSSGARVAAQLQKTQGKVEAHETLIRNKMDEIVALEASLKEKAELLTMHDVRDDVGGLPDTYTESQRSPIREMTTIRRRLGTMKKEAERFYRELDGVKSNLDSLKEKESELGEDGFGEVDSKGVVEEMKTVRQMAKLCVGRQGNHFPILMKQYFRGTIRDIGTRENVLNILADCEYLDPGIFLRTFKQQTNRIVPNVVLVPCYGDMGVCWEPFERFNRATSRGRIAIPMYAKDIRMAVVAALGDLRWQVAKEKAQHYWMEEGLTGWYYQWFTDEKKKGDVREQFIQDYILWITKESEGTQKLERGARGVLWRYVPFPQDIKDKLKNRGYVYSELYKKDQNRAMSDGY